ncbi:hypothetical protein E0K83_08700 [Gramella sp. BOM4]|nr:hypothetical protein [Christiangramia bathymodioli]
MKEIKNILLVFTAFLILLPSGVSFSHVFSGHEHSVCSNYAEFHFHKKPVDCDLQKFQKNPAIQLDLQEYGLYTDLRIGKSLFDYYQFLNDFEALPFDLRGPPHTA